MGKALDPLQQWVRLKSSPIARGRGLVQKGELIWDFDARPSPLGRLYRLRIRAKGFGSPCVTVLSPNLSELAEARPLPHVYSQKPARLCLHFPQHDEWSCEKPIAETIVPWAYLWLEYFEHWLATDEWHGGGKHHGDA